MRMNKIVFFQSVAWVSLVCVLTGCAAMKRKLTRKEKVTRQPAVQPILDPVEYTEEEVSAEMRHSRHFGLWSVWDRELQQYLSLSGRSSSSVKRKKYLIGQMIGELENIKILLPAHEAAALDKILSDYHEIARQLDGSAGTRSDVRIRSHLRKVSKNVRSRFNPEQTNGIQDRNP